MRSLPRWGTLTKLWHDLKEVPCPASLSSLRQCLLQPVLTRSVFGCCSFVAFGALFPSCLELAGVANHLILVAITGELVLAQGSWVVVGCHWRVALPESAEKQVQSIRVQDLDLLKVPRVDNRRLEVVADGFPLFHGAQLAIDTTMVSVVRVDGVPRRQCVGRDGAALDQARRTKEFRYPELSGDQGRPFLW